MDLRLMGDVAIYAGATPVTLPRTGERCVLATLAMNPARRVHTDTLIAHLWDDDPPANAEHTIASYVRTVRRAIEQAGGQRNWLSNHRPRSYQLDIAADLVDYHRFRTLVAIARDQQRAGPAAAVAAYEQAIQLRHGEALANVSGQWAQHRRYAIEQEYLDAVHALYEQQLAIGQFAAVAASAAHLIAEVTPTDRIILLAAHGLSGSGQHAAIPDFVDRATRRMWAAAEARPSAETITTVRELVAHPCVRPALPAIVPSGPLQAATITGAKEPACDAAGEPHVPGERPSPEEPTRQPTITMMATHNQQVYQAAGDQHIAGE